jgi:Tol biopolymer transport system component/DNA-binding winged helix-turn-helix (wHTH) protein
MQDSDSQRRICFGPFEVDRTTGELCKRGRRLKLAEQPFQVLAALLEKPGELVTREDLRQRIWSDDTFVDFDHGLNKAVNKVREVLGDSSSDPRYVETLPRRGYRFIAPVESVGREKALDASAPAPTDEPPLTSRWTLVTKVVIGVPILAGALAATWWLIHEPAEQSVPPYTLTPLTFDSGLTYQPSISPDGKFVVFASDRAGQGNLDLWIMQIGAGEPAPVTSDPADEYEPSFSPDGTRIAFRSDRNGGGIYVVPALGGDPRLIAEGGHWPKFSPNGTLIAYRDGNRFSGRQIFVVPAEGGEPRRLGPNWDETDGKGHRRLKHPIWSADGQHLLYDNDRDWVVVSAQGGRTTATGAKTVLEQQGLELRQSTPEAWRADDHSIVFSSRDVRGQTNLWRLAVSRSSWEVQGPAEPLTVTTGSALQASVSVTGRTVFANLVENSDLWSLPINADQGKILGELEQITDDARWEDFPSISADGRKLVFGVDRYNRPFTFAGSRDIHLLDLVTGERTPLANTSLSELAAVISPDGSRVVHMVSKDDQFAIHIVATNGGRSKLLRSNTSEPTAWSADGRSILYWMKGGGRKALGCGIGEERDASQAP